MHEYSVIVYARDVGTGKLEKRTSSVHANSESEAVMKCYDIFDYVVSVSIVGGPVGFEPLGVVEQQELLVRIDNARRAERLFDALVYVGVLLLVVCVVAALILK